MHDCGSRSSRLRFRVRVAEVHGRPWLPLIFDRAMMFWTVALGLGGWSFDAGQRAGRGHGRRRAGADGDGADARRPRRPTGIGDPSGFPSRWRSLRNPRTWTTTPGLRCRPARSRRARARRPSGLPGLAELNLGHSRLFGVSARSVAKIRARMSDRQDDKRGPRRVPLLPLRDIVVFPHMVVPLFVGREKSISALEEAMAKGARQGDLPRPRSARRRPTSRSPRTSSRSGRSGTIIQLLRLPDGTVKVLVEGKRRARDPALHRRPTASSWSRSRRSPSRTSARSSSTR